MPDTDTIQDEPEVAQDQQEDQQPAPPPQQGPGPQQPSLKDEDKQRLVKIIQGMEKAGEPSENIKAVVKRFQEVNAPAQITTPVDKGIRQTNASLNQPLQFNGTFTPDLEGEKKGLYVNDPDYQKQKNEFVNRIATDPTGNLLYPEQDDKTGKWSNYYTKQSLPGFDPRQIEGAILQVPHKYLPATNGKKFITPVYDSKTNSYNFPGVQTPDVPTEQTLPEATVYGKKPGAADNIPYAGPTKLMVDESDKQKGDLRGVLKEHPELADQVNETLKKYGSEYGQSLANGSPAMANVLQKTIEDHYNLNQPLPANVNADALNGHLNVLNNFEKNRQTFELSQQDLQRQADLATDRAKRTGQPVSQEDANRLAQKASENVQKWNNYAKSVQFSQNYVNQPEVKSYLDEFTKRQKGLSLIDEVRQRAFPDDVNNQIKQDEYDRKAIEGNLNAWDYTKTAIGKAASGLSNIAESIVKMEGGRAIGDAAEMLNSNAQEYLKSNLPAISPDAIEQMNKEGLGHLVNDLSSTVGGFAPYIIPGMAEEGLGAKAATFATALAESMPQAKQEALKQGLTGSAFNTFIAAKPLVSAAFMTLLPNAKFAKGFDNDVAKAVVNGEFNNTRQALLNLAKKVITPHPGDIAHLQAMLSGTALGENLVNKITNGLQATQDVQRGISRKEGLPVEMSDVFNPKQTAVMALAGKLMEAVPTLKNSIGEMKDGREVQETYNHIQNNLLELAGHNLQGVSDKVNELVKNDPGNLYAQHLKNTLEDYAHAEARMPSGLEPEQKSALFDVQQKISEKQRQMATADPVYQPHLQKNIDELNKQIPEIFKDPKKANDYLATGHKQFAREILNPGDADAAQIKSNKQNDLAELKDREAGLDPKSPAYGVKKEALEKERSETEDYYDNRLKNITSPKTKTDGKTENAPETEGRQEIEKPDEGATNASGDAGPPSIQPESWARTLDYGDNKGKDENQEAQEKIKKEILNDDPIGSNGERFSELLGRVIPGIQKVMSEDPHNTTVVTHSSVIKALHVWEDMGRPDISELKGDKLKEFAQKYVDLKPEAEGKVHTFKADNGNDVKVVRHGETEDNKLSEFREDDTKLTDKGEAQAARAGENLINETGGKIPKIISSDLPRTMHTSDIINQKLAEHGTLQKSESGKMGVRDEATVREGVGGQDGSERPTVESGQAAGGPDEEKQKDADKEDEVGGPPAKEPNADDLPFGPLDTGISHQAQIDRTTADLDVSPPDRGEGITLPESIQRGKDLLKAGANVDKIVKDFKADNKVSSDDMAVVRARYNELADKTNKAYDKYGKDSEEAKTALKEERDFYNDAVKPMQTEWSRIGVAQQGRVDLDTGSVTAIIRAYEERNEEAPTEAQKEEIEKLVQKVNGLEKGIADLKSKMDETMKSGGKVTYTEKAKKAADAVRKLKNKPFTFKDENGNEVPIQKMGVGWNELVELGAKAIEKTGEIADGIAAILDKLKDVDWYNGLSDSDKGRFEEQLTAHFQNMVSEKAASAQEIAANLANKTGNDFTREEAKSVWDYLKTHYLDKDTPFGDAVQNTATDLGINAKQVVKALATPKGGKELTTEMYKKQYERRKALDYAKRFIEAGKEPAAKKFFRSLPSVFFNLKTYGHGTVGNITHAGPNIFRPSVWAAYWPNVIKSFGLAYGKTGNYEKAVSTLTHSPNYVEWKRAGLAVDPHESYDDYQVFGRPIKKTLVGKLGQYLGEAGTKGFTGLKFMRYDMAETFYNRASESAKADPNLRKEIAKLVNHATGHTEIKVSKTIKAITFAPGLEVSRWQRMIGDPAKAVNTLATWGKRTPAERAAAKIVFAGAGEKLATYGALLAANAGLLSATGSKQTVNTTDPTKSDWLKFKFGGKTLDMTGGVLGPIRLLSTLTKEAYLSIYGDAKDLRTKPADKDAQTLFQQARYKLSPLAGDVADVATGTDAMGNVEPWSNIKPSSERHKMDWFDYGTQQLPIPIAAGISAVTDAMQERGMSKPEINDILNGALQFTVEGFTGAKLNPDYSLEAGGTGGGAGAGGSYGGHRQRQREH